MPRTASSDAHALHRADPPWPCTATWEASHINPDPHAHERLCEQGQSAGWVGWGDRPGVLVVDFSYGFTSPESPLGSDMTSAVLATRRLLDAARLRDVPVWYTTVAYRSDLADAGIWPRKQPAQRHLIEGSRWVEIDSRLARRENEVVVVKRFPSAFFGTPLQTMLVSAGVDTLVIGGCTTGCCVRSTVVDAMQSGYRVLVPRECVADRRRAAHEMHLEEIGRLFADVLPVETAIRMLNRSDHVGPE